MRVIRTELYFDPSSIEWKANKPLPNPGIAVAWLPLGDGIIPDVKELLAVFDEKSERMREDPFNIFSLFIDLAIQGIGGRDAARALREQKWYVANEHIAKAVLDAEIAVERSPLQTLPLKELLKRSSAVAIGTFIGYAVADPNYPLMFLTIPGGVIVMGIAIGVSKGFENGLNQVIEKRLKRFFK